MAKSDDGKFKGVYEVDDGYAGKSRPKYFTIDKDIIPDDADDDILEAIFDKEMQEHYDNHISPIAKNKEEFIAWAHEWIKSEPDNGDEFDFTDEGIQNND